MEHFPKDSRVVFIGDSITAVNQFTARIVDYYYKNRPELGVKFYNNGVSGGSAMSALLYFDADALPFQPTHAVIMLGVNDSRRDFLSQPRTPERDAKLTDALDEYRVRMESLCDHLDAKGIAVTLCTPAPYAEFYSTAEAPLVGGHALILRYAECVRTLAKQRVYPLVDFHARLSELYLDEPIYNADHVHPNDLGYARMAECLLTAQELPVRPLVIGEAPDAISPKLDEWHELVCRKRTIYAVEWMVVRNFELPLDEKLALVSDYVASKRWGDFLYFETVTKAYLKDKPIESELTARIHEIMENLYT